MFGRSDQRRLEGVDGGEEKCSGKDGRRDIKACAKGGNGPNILDSQERDMSSFRIGGCKEVEFVLSTGSSTCQEALFWGKGEMKGLDAAVVEVPEGSVDVVTGENHRIIDCNDIGALYLVARSLERGEKRGHTTVCSDIGDKGTIAHGVGGNMEAEGRLRARDTYRLGEGLGKRVTRESEVSEGGVSSVSRKRGTIADTLQMLNVRRESRDREIIHALIKTNMGGNLDAIRFTIKPKDIFGRIREKTKENAFARIGVQLVRAAARGPDPDTAAESPEAGEILTFGGGKCDGGRGLILGRKGIAEPEVMMEGIRPKTGIKISTKEHGTESVSDCKVGTLHRAILMRGVGTSWSNRIAVALEEGSDLGVAIKFTALVHVDVFMGTRRGMMTQEMIEPVDGGGFAAAGIAIKVTGEVVRYQNPACFTIEALVEGGSGGIGGGCASKREVDGQTLKGDGGCAGRMGASGGLGLFGSNAGGAEVEDRVMVGKLGDTVNVAMGIVEVMIAGMAKALVPKETISAGAERKDGSQRTGRLGRLQ